VHGGESVRLSRRRPTNSVGSRNASQRRAGARGALIVRELETGQIGDNRLANGSAFPNWLPARQLEAAYMESPGTRVEYQSNREGELT